MSLCRLTNITVPSYHTFASAGSDGLVSIWDHTAKKRLRQYPKYHNAVNAVAFNKTGTKLAVGVSYGWDKGAEGARLPESSRVSIFVREVGDEVKVCKIFLYYYFSRGCGILMFWIAEVKSMIELV